jgi:hypothetical protein
VIIAEAPHTLRLENKLKVESDELTSFYSCSVVMARML